MSGELDKDALKEVIARALQASAAVEFSAPVHFYVEGEANRRFDEETDFAEIPEGRDFIMESWALFVPHILAALDAAGYVLVERAVIDALVAALEPLRFGMAQSSWHTVGGEEMKRILVAKSAIERIDAALALATQSYRVADSRRNLAPTAHSPSRPSAPPPRIPCGIGIGSTSTPIATPAMIAAAWATWKTRGGHKLGPGPAFREAIEAALQVYEMERTNV